MAQRVEYILVDDIDQSPADETVRFALDGVSYEVDLSEANADALRTALARYIGVARRTGGRRARGTGLASRKSTANEVRSWAVENGYEVSPRGRVPAAVREAYEKAHS